MKKLLIPILLFAVLPLQIFKEVEKPKLYKKLNNYVISVSEEFDQIPDDRKEELAALSDFIYQKNSKDEPTKLTVICTHNSRRSHMGQLWLMVAAEWYGMEEFIAYSGGTEKTAVHINAVEALRRAGFKISNASEKTNGTYKASYKKGSPMLPSVLLFSKKYDYLSNPKENFAAIMVCGEADESCPVVPGTDARFSLPFDDPRYFDGTASEALKYDETCRQIAREMLYTVSLAKEKIILDKEKQKGNTK